VVHTQVFVVVVVGVAEPVPCALVVVMLELLGPVKLEVLVAVKPELLGAVKLELLVVVKLEPVVVVKLEPVAAMLEPVAAMLEPATGPPVDNLEPVEYDVTALLVKQAVRYLICAIEW
jgi:hypothetical protein